MRKIFIILIVISGTATLLCSCAKEDLASDMIKKRLYMLSQDKDEKRTEKVFKKIIDAIKNSDDAAMKELFSEKVIDENFDEDIKSLFKFIEGKIISWEKTGGGGEELTDDGNIKKEIQYYSDVVTDKERYHFSLNNVTVDTDNPENVGIRLLMVYRTTDENKVLDPMNKLFYEEVDGEIENIPHSGIYIPIK